MSYVLLLTIAFLLPFQFYLNINGIPIAIGYVLASLLIGKTIAHTFLYPKTVFPKVLVYFCLFITASFLSLYAVRDYTNFWVISAQLLLYAFFYWTVVNTVTTRKEVGVILKVILVSGVISALVGILQFIIAITTGPEHITSLFYDRFGLWIFGVRGLERIGDANRLGYFFRSDLPGVGSAFRAFGFFGGGNSFGFYHALIYALLLPFVVWRKNTYWLLAFTGAIILATAVFLSWSRMAWLMLFFSTIYSLQRGKTNILKLLSGVIISLVLILLLTFIFPDFPLSRAINATITQSDASTISRLRSMENSLLIWKDSPWIGGGLGNFPALASESTIGRVSTLTAESLYLELLAELGFIGFSTFIFLLMKIGQESHILVNHHSPQIKILGRSFKSFWLATLLGFAFNAILTEPRTMLMWWLVVGLMTVSRRIAQAQHLEESQSKSKKISENRLGAYS